MKIILIIAFILELAFSKEVYAQKIGYIEEVETLGYIAGQGMACGASKFQTFEMLARAILITKAPTDQVQAKGMYAYNRAKADGYYAKQVDGFFDCDNINRRFDNQLIYQITLYADGSLKMPDGKLFTPRHPYDATLLYKDRNDRSNAQKIYDRGKKVKVGKVTIQDASVETKNTNQPTVNQNYKKSSTIGHISR